MPRLAVLPFDNLGSPEDEYFSDGMTEELISKLSRVQGLQVAARTSVARFEGTDRNIREIGEELGVRYVLEGSVRKAGDRVRITAQLIDASTRRSPGFQPTGVAASAVVPTAAPAAEAATPVG